MSETEFAPLDAITMALTPGSPFNQTENPWRSAGALGQFAGISQGAVLALVVGEIMELITIKPSARHPERGPLIALTEFTVEEDGAGVAQMKIMAGTAVDGGSAEEALLEVVNAANACDPGEVVCKINPCKVALDLGGEVLDAEFDK